MSAAIVKVVQPVKEKAVEAEYSTNFLPQKRREEEEKYAQMVDDETDIQKLNYLIACLKGDALQAVRGYDITPENYNVIRTVLVEKFVEQEDQPEESVTELMDAKDEESIAWRTRSSTRELRTPAVIEN
ncbi:Zinc knuckle family protein [Dirofilaria immitis]|nr:Zinc knuckle family protein [Dirofilaria immitis]